MAVQQLSQVNQDHYDMVFGALQNFLPLYALGSALLFLLFLLVGLLATMGIYHRSELL